MTSSGIYFLANRKNPLTRFKRNVPFAGLKTGESVIKDLG